MVVYLLIRYPPFQQSILKVTLSLSNSHHPSYNLHVQHHIIDYIVWKGTCRDGYIYFMYAYMFTEMETPMA